MPPKLHKIPPNRSIAKNVHPHVRAALQHQIDHVNDYQNAMDKKASYDKKNTQGARRTDPVDPAGLRRLYKNRPSGQTWEELMIIADKRRADWTDYARNHGAYRRPTWHQTHPDLLSSTDHPFDALVKKKKNAGKHDKDESKKVYITTKIPKLSKLAAVHALQAPETKHPPGRVPAKISTMYVHKLVQANYDKFPHDYSNKGKGPMHK